MLFTKTNIPGSFLIEAEKRTDERGFFARVWCEQELQEHGLACRMVQANVGFSHRRGTLRGLHYQLPPYEEIKLVRCTQGAVYDVVVDLRFGSPTYRQWVAAELTAANHLMLWAPAGCAHGYLTLTGDAEILYQTSQFYMPEYARGIRYDDSAVGIDWPSSIEVISGPDTSWPLLAELGPEGRERP